METCHTCTRSADDHEDMDQPFETRDKARANWKARDLSDLAMKADELREQVYQIRDLGDDGLRRAQGLLSEVRDLVIAASKEASRPMSSQADRNTSQRVFIRATAVRKDNRECVKWDVYGFTLEEAEARVQEARDSGRYVELSIAYAEEASR